MTRTRLMGRIGRPPGGLSRRTQRWLARLERLAASDGQRVVTRAEALLLAAQCGVSASSVDVHLRAYGRRIERGVYRMEET